MGSHIGARVLEFWMNHCRVSVKNSLQTLKRTSKVGCRPHAPEGILEAISAKLPKKFSAPPGI